MAVTAACSSCSEQCWLSVALGEVSGSEGDSRGSGSEGEVDLRATMILALKLVPHPHFFVVKTNTRLCQPVFILGDNLGILPLASSL